MEDNIFARIGRGEIPVDPVYEDDDVIAFKDISPEAPAHALVIPKRPIVNIFDLTAEDKLLAGSILLACAEVARRLGLQETGARIVLNAGTDGGQTVPHLHAHIMGGRQMSWPPG